MQDITLNTLYSSTEVALNYGVLNKTIQDHFRRHNDEFIEDIHYIYEINSRFNTKVIKWTLEGIYMLGFFIKSKQAKEYRKKVANFLKLCKENQEKQNAQYLLHVTNGYKSQISQKNTQIAKLKKELKEQKQTLSAKEVLKLIEKGLKYDRLLKDFYNAYNELTELKTSIRKLNPLLKTLINDTQPYLTTN